MIPPDSLDGEMGLLHSLMQDESNSQPITKVLSDKPPGCLKLYLLFKALRSLNAVSLIDMPLLPFNPPYNPRSFMLEIQ